jgi:topoisomerase IA-like protein
MDPGTGNIYTKEEAETLGLDGNDLIPLEDDEAAQLLEERRVQAQVLAEKRLDQRTVIREVDAKMRDQAEARNKKRVRAKNKMVRTARRGNR